MRSALDKRRSPALFSIASHRAFSDSLAEGLVAQFGEELARGIVLVPNNRAAMALQDAFVRKAESGLLLPRMVPVGDPDLGENVGSALDPLDVDPIPPAIAPLLRQVMLAQMVQETSQIERLGTLDGSQSMRLAADLARVIDQLCVERKTAQDLNEIKPESLSIHWANSLKLLTIILSEWPKRLESLGLIDMADRRNRQLDRVAERWRSDPPHGFVIAAGISTGAPAIAALVRQVARLERGQVVFAGLDLAMPEEEWAALAGDDKHRAIETHPQFHLCQVLTRMGASRAEVSEWRWGENAPDRAHRSANVNLAFAPARFTHKWASMSEKARSISGITAMELPTPAQEAQSIALAIREAIEVPEQTVALVTPDRELATRVSALLERWGIEADDSAGRSLSTTRAGSLVLALASAAAERFSAVSLLTLLKHPLVRCDDRRQHWLDGARALDLALRGPQSAPGLNGVDQLLAMGDHRTQGIREVAAAWWHGVKPLLTGLEAAFLNDGGLTALLSGISDAAATLAGEAHWAGQEGKALAQIFERLAEASAHAPWVSSASFSSLFKDLLDAVSIRPARGGHPRVFIWGLLEAKLQSADIMILGGLNEGVWPQVPAPDPWLAPLIRRELDLPGMERRIGLSAHDLAGTMGARRILLTRSKRDAKSPTIASRLWLRLETFSAGFHRPAGEARFDLMAHELDRAEGERASRPRPRPPLEDRPRSISVTQVDGLKADPYAFYARNILRLMRLQPPGGEPDQAWRGTFLHAVLGEWGQQDDFGPGKLLPRLKLAFADSGLHPVIRAFWEPRFEQSAARFEEFVEANRLEGRRPSAAEISGSIEMDGIKLSGQADRIDTLNSGEVAIVDYKTGKAPSDKKVKEGFAVQLGLLGKIAELGGFQGITGKATRFEYWSQSRPSGKEYGLITSPTHGSSRSKSKIDPDVFVEEMVDHFRKAAADWLTGDAPFTAKLHPDYSFSDYDHLMRLDEWLGRDG